MTSKTTARPFSFLTDYHQYQEVVQGNEGATGIPATTAILKTPVLSPGQIVRVDTISVQSTPFSATTNRLKVYKGRVAFNNFVAGTLDSRIWTITQVNLILRPQDFLTFQFLNLDAVQEVYATILGEYLN